MNDDFDIPIVFVTFLTFCNTFLNYKFDSMNKRQSKQVCGQIYFLIVNSYKKQLQSKCLFKILKYDINKNKIIAQLSRKGKWHT